MKLCPKFVLCPRPGDGIDQAPEKAWLNPTHSEPDWKNFFSCTVEAHDHRAKSVETIKASLRVGKRRPRSRNHSGEVCGPSYGGDRSGHVRTVEVWLFTGKNLAGLKRPAIKFFF